LIAAKVSALDEVVGRVVAGLIKSGLYENTIIVFTSDVRTDVMIF
jgi:arylsulfatase A-like enzyme